MTNEKAVYTSIRIQDKDYWDRVKIESIKRKKDISELVIEGLKSLGIK